MKEGSIINNRYLILERIGTGGMGSVFLAKDLELGSQVVALKVLLTDTNVDEEIFKRFRNEVVIARSLTHQNIVRTHDLGRDQDGNYFITMEYVEGKTLRELLKEANVEQRLRGKYENALLAVYLKILDGVAYAHEKGIIHRDIKPANILISKSGEVKIADFGTARSMQLSESLTKTGYSVGTPDYMAPEQIKGTEPDQTCDVYALGILLFEILMGQRPFSGDSPISIAYKQLNEPLPDITELGKEASEELRSALVKATLKSNEERVRNVKEFKNALLACPEFQNILTNSTSSSEFELDGENNNKGTQDNSGSAWTLGGENKVRKTSLEKTSRKSFLDSLLIPIILLISSAALYMIYIAPSTSNIEDSSSDLKSPEANKITPTPLTSPSETPTPLPSAPPLPKLPEVVIEPTSILSSRTPKPKESEKPSSSNSASSIPTTSPNFSASAISSPIASPSTITTSLTIESPTPIPIPSTPPLSQEIIAIPTPIANNLPSTEYFLPKVTETSIILEGMIDILEKSSFTKQPHGLTLFITSSGQEIIGTAKITGFPDFGVSGKEYQRGIEIELTNQSLNLKLVGGKRGPGYRGTYVSSDPEVKGTWSVNKATRTKTESIPNYNNNSNGLEETDQRSIPSMKERALETIPNDFPGFKPHPSVAERSEFPAAASN